MNFRTHKYKQKCYVQTVHKIYKNVGYCHPKFSYTLYSYYYIIRTVLYNRWDKIYIYGL